MTSNCSLYPLEPLLPDRDPAYTDAPLPPRRRRVADDTPEPAWPVASLPSRLRGFTTISFEALEEELEREARRADR